MTQKEKLLRWFDYNGFSIEQIKDDIIARKNVLIRSKNSVYRIIIEINNGNKHFKFELKQKLDNSPSYVTLKTDFFQIIEWETKVKDILTKSKLIRSFRMAEPKVKVIQEEITKNEFTEEIAELENAINDNIKNISVEDAKRILQAEEQKQNLKMEQCKNEIEEILKKYEVDLVTIIDKQNTINILTEFISKPETNYFILHPEIRNLQNIQSQEA